MDKPILILYVDLRCLIPIFPFLPTHTILFRAESSRSDVVLKGTVTSSLPGASTAPAYSYIESFISIIFEITEAINIYKIKSLFLGS